MSAHGMASRMGRVGLVGLALAAAAVVMMLPPLAIAQAVPRAATAPAAPLRLPPGVTMRDVQFYSEAVLCHGRLFLPSGFSAASKAGAVVVAPGQGDTAVTVERVAARLAARGIAALAIDYRGYGRSGGYLDLAVQVRGDDRLRFSQHTPKVRIRRRRLIPQHQVTDIRNAITFLQGEPGVERTRIGVWGTDLAGGHVVTVAAMDARIKAGVAQVPIIDGKDTPRSAFAPTPQQQADMVRLARNGAPMVTPTTAGTAADPETRLALAEYKPFRLLDQVPPAVALLFVVAEHDTQVDNAQHGAAAAKVLKGPSGVTTIPGATHALAGAAADTAADAAVEWLARYL